MGFKLNVDHIDLNRLNNCRSNLRNATHTQNEQNKVSRIGSSSKYKGVSWNTMLSKWTAQIGIEGKKLHLGCFVSEIKAAEAYNKAAMKYFGSFANVNSI